MSQIVSLLAIFVGTLSLTACDADDEINNGSTPNPELRLASITQGNRSTTSSENYLYDSLGRLITIDGDAASNRRTEIVYLGPLVQEVLTFQASGRLIFRDSLAYNEAGQITAVFKYTINLGPDLPLYLIDSFRYDERGRIIQRWTHGFPITQRWREERYAWSDENIILVETFSGTGRRELITKNRFDTRLNFKRYLPMSYRNPEDYSTNNIVWSEVQDFTGLYDPICNPCTTNYRYNKEGYPVLIEYGWDQDLAPRYE